MPSRGFAVPSAIAAVFALLFTLLTVQPAHAAGSITGTVTDSGGQPLANVFVTAFSPSAPPPSGPIVAEVTTTADGTYSLPVPDGSYYVCFWAEFHAEECWNDKPLGTTSLSGGTAVSGGTGGVDAALSDGASRHGKVKTNGGAPVAGAEVSVIRVYENGAVRIWSADTSNADGTFDLTGIPSGKYWICAYKPEIFEYARCYSDGYSHPTYFQVWGADSPSDAFSIGIYRPPTPRVITSGPNYVKYGWEKNYDAHRYQVALDTTSTMGSPEFGLSWGTSITAYQLMKGKTYYFSMRALDVEDYYMTNASKPLASRPGHVNQVRALTRYSSALKIGWAKYAYTTRYRVQISSSSTFAGYRQRYKSSSELATTFDKLTPGKKYYFRVRAYNSNGTAITPWATHYSVTVLSGSPAVSQGSSTAGVASVPCDWACRQRNPEALAPVRVSEFSGSASLSP